MNRADVRVIQGGGGSSLAPETIQGLRVASELVRQKLESDEALEPGVFGLVDHTHPACVQLLDDAVVGDGAADQRIGAYLCGFALLASEGPRGHFYRRILQEPSYLTLRRQQGPDFALQGLVARACMAQKRLALFGRTVQHRLQYVINLFPSFRVHLRSRRSARGRARPWPPSSRA